MTSVEAARILTQLMRCENDDLDHYVKRTGAGEGLAEGDLRWCRDFLLGLAERLDAGDAHHMQLLRHAIDQAAKAPALAAEAAAEMPHRGAEPSRDEPRAMAPEPAVPLPSLAPAVPSVSPSPPPPAAPRGGQPPASPWAAAPQAAPPPPSTAFLDPHELSAAVRAAELPFTGQAAPPPPGAELVGEPDMKGETDWLDPAMFAHLGTPSYPLPPRAPMPLEQYAAIVARTELATVVETTMVHHEYQIADEAHRAAIDAAFEAVFRSEPQQRATFQQHLERCRQWRDRGSGDRAPQPALDATAGVSLGELALATTATLEPEHGAPMHPTRYAVLVLLTEGQTHAARTEVHRRFGLASETARAELDERFGEALRRSGDQRAAYQRALEEWRDIKPG
ncbi:MAG: hypothetical protein R3B72_49750 [Polyangiaceae bacterium]